MMGLGPQAPLPYYKESKLETPLPFLCPEHFHSPQPGRAIEHKALSAKWQMSPLIY